MCGRQPDESVVGVDKMVFGHKYASFEHLC